MGEDWKYLVNRVRFFGVFLMTLCGLFWLKLLYDNRADRMDLILILVIGIFLLVLYLNSCQTFRLALIPFLILYS